MSRAPRAVRCEPTLGATRAIKSGYSAEDLISLGFINSPAHMKLVEESKPLAAVHVDDYDGVLLVGGQGPMYTFWATSACTRSSPRSTKPARSPR